MADAPVSVYLLIPPHLEDELLEPLRRHFADDEHVDVVVERRSSERRPGIDDRILRDLAKPQTERRAQTIPREMPELPPGLAHHAPELRVIQRLAPVRATMAELDLLEVVALAQQDHPEAPTEIMWRTFERVSRRLAVHLKDPREADQAVKGTYGIILDRLRDFDPDVIPFDAWVDRVVDDHAAQLRLPK
jgi:hypothetical protein